MIVEGASIAPYAAFSSPYTATSTGGTADCNSVVKLRLSGRSPSLTAIIVRVIDQPTKPRIKLPSLHLSTTLLL